MCQIGYWQGGSVINCQWKRGQDPLALVALALGSLAMDFFVNAGMWGYLVTVVLIILAVTSIKMLYGDHRSREVGPRAVMDLLGASLVQSSPATHNFGETVRAA
jgi:hypothetical protein